MYRNIVYSPYDREITLFTWNRDGDRVTLTEAFNPYLYIEDNDTRDAISIYNTSLKKLVFDDSFKRKKFVESTPRTFFNLSPEQQFLIERYHGLNKAETFSMYPLRIFFLDIETYSPNGFPDPLLANDPINLITIFDSLSGGYFSFGLQKDYYPNDDKVIYKAFATEEEMIKAFVRWWRKNFPDILTGWYSDGFDLPYICRRINKIYNDPEACNRLSPLDRVYKQENVVKRVAEYKEVWTISGITHIDYQYAYKIFTKDKRASYSLNAIAEEELNIGKLQHNAVSLSSLADNDWQQFCEYNIQDVRLLVRLEDKLQYLQICRELAYRGLSPFPQSLSTVGLVTGVAAQKALEKERIISTFTPPESTRFEGGLVREPQIGLQKALLYYDANSLYPNTIVTVNISPETKFGKIIEQDAESKTIQVVNGKTYKLSNEKFQKFIKSEQIAVSKYNILFTQKTRGIFPNIIEDIYSERVELKKQLKAVKDKLHKLSKDDSEYQKLNFTAQQIDNQQYTKKILLNRIYGYFAEKHSPVYDIDLAASVTLTGQECNRVASKTCYDYLTKTFNIEYDPIIFGDTDSIVVSIDKILQKNNQPFLLNNEINPYVYQIANDLNNEIDKQMNIWASTELNSNHSTYEFKRENISSAGIIVMKKNYILNIRDDEGLKVNKFKYTGVEVVKTSTPKKLKPLMKEVIESSMKYGNPKITEKLLNDLYIKYQSFDIDDLAIPVSLNGYEKYAAKTNGFKVGLHTPIHVKGAIYYNLLLEQLDLQNKYELLKNGTKIKNMYLLPNSYNMANIAFLNHFPDELRAILKMDTKLMFEKTVLNPIKRILDVLNWDIKNPLFEEKIDVLDFFS